MLQTKEFTIGGEKVTATELTYGQYKKWSKMKKDNEEKEEKEDETAYMVALSLGITIEDVDNFPISSLNEVTAITGWLGDVISNT